MGWAVAMKRLDPFQPQRQGRSILPVAHVDRRNQTAGPIFIGSVRGVLSCRWRTLMGQCEATTRRVVDRGSNEAKRWRPRRGLTQCKLSIFSDLLSAMGRHVDMGEIEPRAGDYLMMS